MQTDPSVFIQWYVYWVGVCHVWTWRVENFKPNQQIFSKYVEVIIVMSLKCCL